MSPQTIEALNQLNQQFYSHNAASFAATRQQAWSGWQALLAFMPHKPFSLLDIGCGNGRFEKFLCANHAQLSFYMGIDASVELLEEARKQSITNYPRHFKHLDIIATTNWLDSPNHFDVIGLLAVLHHIPSKKLRQDTLKRAARLLKPGGILIMSLWHYDSDARFSNKTIPWKQVPQISQSELEPGDYVLSWNNEPSKPRYVHIFNEGEIEDLVHTCGLDLIESFRADGKNKHLNQYLILSQSTIQ